MDTYHFWHKEKMDNSPLTTQDICLNFPYFGETLSGAVINACKLFWENDFVVKTQSVTTNLTVKSDLISKGEIYFTSDLNLSAHSHAFIRINSEFVRILFHDCFGSNSPIFKLQNLSELEIKILNAFAEVLITEIKTAVLPREEIPKASLRNKGVVNATFLVGKTPEKTGKIVVTLPQNCILNKKVELRENFQDESFTNVPTFVNILAGTSKISLNDLKNLSPGDILLLENSRIEEMEILAGDIKQIFNINPDPSLIIELDDDSDIEERQMNENNNIWDNIQIEVGAEFDKIKMTLGDLKQISKGLVIDLGPIFKNPVSLFVENKIVAKGELVIINDKYGVKIDEVYSNNDPEPAPQAQQPAQQAPAPGPIPQPQQIQTPPPRPAAPDMVNKMAQGTVEEATGEDEEFDYSDFEDEDR